MELEEQMLQLIQELNASIKALKSNGVKLAETERAYKMALSKEALLMREQKGVPATLISTVIYGIPEVARLRFERDVAQVTYDANKEHINITKLKMRIIEAQIGREWNNAGNGDL